MAGLTAHEAAAARICGYCGCLYLQVGAQKTVRGYIEGAKWTRAND
jgi:hypothetical protein